MTTIHLGDCLNGCATCADNYHSNFDQEVCGACGQFFPSTEADNEGFHSAESCEVGWEEMHEADPTCSDCGKVVTASVCGCGFAVMKMSELTKELNAKGLKATFEMSGGGVGTIYIGEANADGFYKFAVGPGSYGADEIYKDDTCWGVDGSEKATYYTGSAEDFTPAKVAELIANDYRKAN